MGWGRRIAVAAAVLPGLLLGCDDPTPKADPPEPIVLPPHVPGQYPGECMHETDYQNDGVFDGAYRIGYDSRGRHAFWEVLMDGRSIHRAVRRYDDDDREVEADEVDIRRRRDGSSYEEWTRHRYEYDAAGNQIRHTQDRDRDGVNDVVTTTQWNARNQIVEEYIEQRASYVPDSLRQWIYNAQGLPTQYIQVDTQGADVQRRTHGWRYVDGLLVERTRASNGVLFEREVRQWDAAGRLLERSHDSNGDGDFDSTEMHTYAEDGREHSIEKDWDGDAQIDVVHVEIEHPDGSKELRIDEGADGQFDYISVHLLNDEVSMERVDLDGDGSIDWRREAVFRPEGGRSTQQVDEDGDGVFDRFTTFRYGEHGMEEELTVDAEGIVLDYTRLTYDRYGNQLSRESPNYVTRSYYICPWSPFER